MKLSDPKPRAELIASYAYGDPYWTLGISQADRDKAASSGAAMPDGSFPITQCEGSSGSVDSAVGLARTDAQRLHTITRAKALGCASKIPDTWNADGSQKDAATSAKLAVPPPPPKAPPADAPPKAPVADPAEADAAVTDALAKLKAALDAAVAAQKADPDNADPKDEKVAAGLDTISQALEQLTEDQEADSAGNADAPAKPPPKPAAVTAATPPPAEGTAKAPVTSPVDEKGNVAPDAVCANPDCQHLASSHLNDDAAGANTGACQMTSCECLGFQAETQPNSGSGDDQPAQDAQPGPKSQELAHAPIASVPDAPAPPGPATIAKPPEMNAPPPIEGGQPMGPAFTIPVAIIEGQPTGDGRQIAPGALTWRAPPLPLMGLATETHDPMGMDPNDPAVICGRIDSLERAPGQGDTQIIVAKGYYLPNDDGAYFAELNEKMDASASAPTSPSARRR